MSFLHNEAFEQFQFTFALFFFLALAFIPRKKKKTGKYIKTSLECDINFLGRATTYLVLKMLQLTTPENTITYHNVLCLSPQNFAQALFSVSLGAILTPKRN